MTADVFSSTRHLTVTLQVNTDITGTYVHENNHRDTVSLNRRNSIVSVVSDKGVISRESTVTNGKMISEQWQKTRWKARITAYMKPHPRICLKGLPNIRQKLEPGTPYSSLTSPSLLLSINPQHSPWEPRNWPSDTPCFKEFHSSSSYSRKPTPRS